MRSPIERDQAVRNLLNKNLIASMSELKTAADTDSKMTVLRSLSRMGYYSSYSHRGQYYTLADIPDFDDLGLWSCRGMMFSKHGSLINTAASLVTGSEAGYTASELEAVLQVEVKHVLLQLVRRAKLMRSKVEGRFVYMSVDSGERRRQRLMRAECNERLEVGSSLETAMVADELKAGIILFFSLLDEKQRRLYAGMEAARLGHGGDRKIAALLDLDPHTVAKGRRELFSGRLERGRVRRAGGGAKRAEKKRQR
jgi:hypothetical protein